jgi:hypothetical protein
MVMVLVLAIAELLMQVGSECSETKHLWCHAQWQIPGALTFRLTQLIETLSQRH